MAAIHEQLGGGRWATFSMAEQLGNIGSEYERACRAKQQDNTKRFEAAFARLLDLMDLTLADHRWHNHRLKELCRLRELLCEELLSDVTNNVGSFKNYFLNFALLARAGT